MLLSASNGWVRHHRLKLAAHRITRATPITHSHRARAEDSQIRRPLSRTLNSSPRNSQPQRLADRRQLVQKCSTSADNATRDFRRNRQSTTHPPSAPGPSPPSLGLFLDMRADGSCLHSKSASGSNPISAHPKERLMAGPRTRAAALAFRSSIDADAIGG